MEVIDCDWASFDSWWESHVDIDQSVLTEADSLVLDSRWLDGQWASIDDWWERYVSTDQSALVDETTITLDDRLLAGGWIDLDNWWQSYSKAHQEDVEELLATLKKAEKVWAAGPSQFDTDPLSADWQTVHGSTGPIRLVREEDWSYALAYLFMESGVLINELFNNSHDGTPDSVETEAHLPGGSETTRYEDILIINSGGGISIEVKIHDTNFQKTVETAELVERHHSGDWTHVLLLPAYQYPQLRDAFGRKISEPAEGHPIITATPFDNRDIEVQIRNWKEISTALRRILQQNDEISPHWAASAYVVCTLIEQKILGFVPKPIVKQQVATNDIVHDNVSLAAGIQDIENEISYLQATNEDTNNG
ncbi:hypothetical protein [Halovivax cerinus]|uniref:Uncharacterized protein n=1 Tax=Halovivax cerinus TaxID=1487865 RepID=A0ABD5NQD1_9EURY|nr:hypothetical protein [Halovivax cerinus]